MSKWSENITIRIRENYEVPQKADLCFWSSKFGGLSSKQILWENNWIVKSAFDFVGKIEQRYHQIGDMEHSFKTVYILGIV